MSPTLKKTHTKRRKPIQVRRGVYRDRIVLAALACLSNGWMFGAGGTVSKPDAVRKLENALHAYKAAGRTSKVTTAL